VRPHLLGCDDFLTVQPQVALNHYETLENLEQAIDIITTTLTKCDFYHCIYDAFVRQMPASALVRHEVFNTFNTTLPELYADVFEVAFKTEGYFNPRSCISKCRRDPQLRDDIHQG